MTRRPGFTIAALLVSKYRRASVGVHLIDGMKSQESCLHHASQPAGHCAKNGARGVHRVWLKVRSRSVGESSGIMRIRDAVHYCQQSRPSNHRHAIFRQCSKFGRLELSRSAVQLRNLDDQAPTLRLRRLICSTIHLGAGPKSTHRDFGLNKASTITNLAACCHMLHAMHHARGNV